MAEYRFLGSSDNDAVFEAFQLAFSDYQVDMRMSREQFAYRLLRDGIRLSRSVGAFEGKELVGFCLSGVGTWNGEHTIYDAGTGVVPDYRRRGIGEGMFDFMLPRLKQHGFSQYLLEVISSNDGALRLYRKLGFRDTRKLKVLRLKSQLPNREGTESQCVREVETPDWRLYQSFWEFDPSWQNSIDAAKRIAEDTVILEVLAGGQCVGYGIVSRSSGSLFQLAVDKSYRRKRFGSMLLSELQLRVLAGEPLKVNNIDAGANATLSFYESNGFGVALEQHELVRRS